MSAKMIRFPFHHQTLVMAVDNNISIVAPEEIGYGLSATIFLCLKQYLHQIWRLPRSAG